MSFRWKLVLSHLIAILIGLSVLAISTAFIAPLDFSQHMMGNMPGMMGSSGDLMDRNMVTFQSETESAFRNALYNALLVAGSAALFVAVLLSSYLSTRIVRPLRRLVKASQQIAAGRYDQRLYEGQMDEIGELIHNFNKMASALTGIEQTRQQLIADVSHELNTPLASIKGYMEGLQDGVIAPTVETFQLVHNEAERLRRLVHDLQELSRAEAAQLPITIQLCHVANLVAKAISALRPQFDAKGVQLQTDTPATQPAVRADPDRIHQVLVNLLGNALQHTPSSGKVTIHTALDGPAIRFSVQDTGTGLEANDLERIFIRFYRVDKSRARSSGGSGIGLTIARYIVEAHSGRIWAESTGKGLGSVFHFTLPLA